MEAKGGAEKLEGKAKFFAQYWGQDVFLDSLGLNVSGLEIFRPEFINGIHAKLKPLSQITEEDAIEVARLSHQLPKADFKVLGDNGYKQGQSLECDRGSGITYRTYINFSCGSVSTFMRISPEYEFDLPSETFTKSIGKADLSSSRPTPYIGIVDYLRSKGYALEWNGVKVKEQEKLGWIKLEKYD